MTDLPRRTRHNYAPPLDERLVARCIERVLGRSPAALAQRATKRPRYVYEAAFDIGAPIIFKAEVDSDGDDAIVLECWAMERAREAGVPAPRVLGTDWSCAEFPGRYALFERIPGGAIEELRLEERDRAHVLREAGVILRRLHSVPVAGYGRLDDEEYLERGEVRGAHVTWRAAALEPALRFLTRLRDAALFSVEECARFERLLQADPEAFPEQLDARLLHGDFDASHIFVDQATGAVTGVIDFGDREAGDPAWDLAGLALWDGDEALRAVLTGYEGDATVGAQLAARAHIYLIADALRLAGDRAEAGRAADAASVAARLRELVAILLC